MAFFTRITFVSTGLKDYILAYVNNPFPNFLVSAIVMHGYYTAEATFIGNQFGKLEGYLNDERSWSNKSTLEQVSLILMSIFIVISLLAVTWVGRIIHKKIYEVDDCKNSESQGSTMKSILN